MPEYNVHIVGMRHHAPALAILQCLPGDCELTLVRQPDNPYDANAIQVFVNPKVIPEGHHETLDTMARGYGSSAEEILAQDQWMLGFVSASEAKSLSPQLNGDTTATLTFNAEGKPKAKVVLEPAEAAAE